MNSKGIQPCICIYPFSSSSPLTQAATCIRQSSPHYTVGPCCLSILNVAVCTCPSQTPSLSFPSFSPATMSCFSESFFLCCKLQLWFQIAWYITDVLQMHSSYLNGKYWTVNQWNRVLSPALGLYFCLATRFTLLLTSG